jgi:hypothetical protein
MIIVIKTVPITSEKVSISPIPETIAIFVKNKVDIVVAATFTNVLPIKMVNNVSL